MATTTIKNKPVLKKKTAKTSKAAAPDNNARKSQRFLLLEAYYKAGKSGLTAEEAAEASGLLLPGICYWKRVSELLNSFLIDFVEVPNSDTYDFVTRANKSGRQAQVYQISTEGKDEFKFLRGLLK